MGASNLDDAVSIIFIARGIVSLFPLYCNLLDFIHRWRKSKPWYYWAHPLRKSRRLSCRILTGFKLWPRSSQHPDKPSQIVQNGRLGEKMHHACLDGFCGPPVVEHSKCNSNADWILRQHQVHVRTGPVLLKLTLCLFGACRTHTGHISRVIFDTHHH